MNGLDIFAGSGIGSLAFKHIIPNYRTIGYVEYEEYPCKIIEARIKDKILDDAPIWQIDIREFNRRIAPIYKGMVDIVYGGFPCQPFSVAGKKRGSKDERNMWPATANLISILRPKYVLLENVSGLISHQYVRQIFGDLAKIGYDCEWDIVGASDVGAPHKRKRVWILAYSTNDRDR
jgi:DNA (cytosine-5)-methyltransferase 1